MLYWPAPTGVIHVLETVPFAVCRGNACLYVCVCVCVCVCWRQPTVIAGRPGVWVSFWLGGRGGVFVKNDNRIFVSCIPSSSFPVSAYDSEVQLHCTPWAAPLTTTSHLPAVRSVDRTTFILCHYSTLYILYYRIFPLSLHPSFIVAIVIIVLYVGGSYVPFSYVWLLLASEFRWWLFSRDVRCVIQHPVFLLLTSRSAECQSVGGHQRAGLLVRPAMCCCCSCGHGR